MASTMRPTTTPARSQKGERALPSSPASAAAVFGRVVRPGASPTLPVLAPDRAPSSGCRPRGVGGLCAPAGLPRHRRRPRSARRSVAG